MRYLKNREQFLEYRNNTEKRKVPYNTIVNEVYESDITWGGSLLGRLINSTIRKGTALIKHTRINSIIKQVQIELDNLVGDVVLDDENKNYITNQKYRFLLTELYNIVISDDDLNVKLTKLLGNKKPDSGFIVYTIEEIKKLEIDDKNILIKKLEDFRNALLEYDFDESDDDIDDNTSSEKSPEFKFYLGTIDLFKSIIQLNNVINSVKVKIEGDPDSSTKYSTQTKKKDVDSNNPDYLKGKKAGQFAKNALDSGDILKANSMKDKAKASSNFEYKKGFFDVFMGDDSDNIDRDALTDKSKNKKAIEGFSNFIIENTEVIRLGKNDDGKRKEPVEKDAINSWRKILNAHKNGNIDQTSKLLQEIIDNSKSGNKLDKSIIIAIGKNVLLNEQTTGKPIGFEALIKEEAGVIPSKYLGVSKNISLLSRILLSFKDDMGLIGSFGEAIAPIKKFIGSYNAMKEIYPKLGKKNESYKIFEAIDKDKDKVVSSWFKFFSEGEEEEWAITEEDKKVMNGIEKESEKEKNTDAKSHQDSIIKIINLFSKAYKLYASDVIPSGRPNGRVSQKTFREYIYIGDDSRGGKWEPNEGPEGPFAYKITFEKWEDGIMRILEDTKYRKVLANIKFKNVGPNQDIGSGEKDQPLKKIVSGRSLLDFINGMINPEGGFRKYRRTIMKEYFGGVDDAKLEDTKPTNDGDGKKRKIEKGESTKLVSFINPGSNGINRRKIDLKSISEEYKGEFLKIKVRSNNKDTHIIAYVVGEFEENLVIKYNYSESGANQNIISDYLYKDISKNIIELDKSIVEDNKRKMYLALIPFESNNKKQGLSKGDLSINEFEIKSGGILSDSDSKNIKILSDIMVLGRVKDIDKALWETINIKKSGPQKLAKNDIKNDFDFSNLK